MLLQIGNLIVNTDHIVSIEPSTQHDDAYVVKFTNRESISFEFETADLLVKRLAQLPEFEKLEGIGQLEILPGIGTSWLYGFQSLEKRSA